MVDNKNRYMTAEDRLPSKSSMEYYTTACWRPIFWKTYMLMSYAILVDGGFVRRKLGNRIDRMDASKLGNFINRVKVNPHLQDMHLHRIYYYDSEPLKDKVTNPMSGTEVDFSASDLYTHSMNLFKELRDKPFFAMRMGEMSNNGWRIKRKRLKLKNTQNKQMTISDTDIEANVSQKGVDMRIGLDMASLALKQQVQTIVLISGDSDFVPAMKFVRIEGRQIFLVTLGHGIKDKMREHADVILDIDMAGL